MKITKRQLRRIIKEGNSLNELFGFGKKKMNPDGTECKGCKGLKWAQNDVEIQGWQDRYAKSGQWFMKRREDPKFAEPRMPDDEHYMRGWKRGEQDADDEVKYAHIQLKERVTEKNAMKISKRQLKRIIKEEKAKLNENEGLGAAQEAAVEQIEKLLNDLWDQGLSNGELIALLQGIITDIQRGFVGEPR